MENKNGQGIFYGVIGVATLVVAIIGATFAYFSAQASSNEGDISGGTLDVQGTALSMVVNKYTGFGTTATAGTNLVPAKFAAADIDSTSTAVNATGLGKALSADCVKDGYTGCHVYTITATSGSSQAAATIDLVLTLTGVTVQSDWKYVVYTGTDAETPATTNPIVKSGAFAASGDTTVNILNGELSQGDTIYYLMIYLNDDDGIQNETTGTNAANAAVGTYSGTVTLQAAGGRVNATFSS